MIKKPTITDPLVKTMNKQTKIQTHVLKDLQLEILSWNQIYSLLIDLTALIKNSDFVPDTIVGICRGGWIPARIFSDLLENSNLFSVATSFYLGVNETKPKPVITQEISGSVKGKKVLVVDDLVDSGKSLKLVLSYIKNEGASKVKTATLYRKPWSVIVPDYCLKETGNWVVFPWDQKETVRNVFMKFQESGNSVNEIKEKLISFGLNNKLVNQIYEEQH